MVEIGKTFYFKKKRKSQQAEQSEHCDRVFAISSKKEKETDFTLWLPANLLFCRILPNFGANYTLSYYSSIFIIYILYLYYPISL